MRSKAISGALLVVLTCCHTSTSGESGAAGESEPIPLVETAPVVRGTATLHLELAGTLQPLPGADVKLAPLGAGRLEELRVGEGDAVRAGALLARLDPLPLRAQLEGAKAQLEEARAQAENARLREARSLRAVDAGVAARQELEDAQLGARTAEAQVRAAQGALAAAGNQLARSELRAPFDGLVARVFAAQGESIDAGKPVLEVARTRELELRAAVPAESAALLRPGEPCEVRAAGVRAGGRVLAVAPVIDAVTGALTVRLQIDNPDGALKAGELGRAQVFVAQHANALLVPRAALLPDAPDAGAGDEAEGGAGRICVVGADSIARCAPVQTRPAQDGMVEILSGPGAGALAIVQGAYALPDGTRVRTAQRAAGPGEEVGTPTNPPATAGGRDAAAHGD